MLDLIHSRFIYSRRIDILAGHLAGRIDSGSTILDIGCGDGRLSGLIGTRVTGSSLIGIDTLKRPDTHIEVLPYDGINIPLPDRSVDVCLLVDTLHHTDEPFQLLREADRVTRQAIVIKDHLADSFFSRPLLCFMDWVGNRRHGVSLPLNYLKEAEWKGYFDRLQWRIEHWDTNLNIYPPWCSWLFDRRLHFIACLTVNDAGTIPTQHEQPSVTG